MEIDSDVAVVGAGVVGSATALALARRGASVTLLEAEAEPGLAASGTNSGILHTGFDSSPGELETRLILRSAQLRDPVLEALGLPVLRCGALLRPLAAGDWVSVRELAANAERNEVEVRLGDDDSLTVPGESVTDPIAYTRGMAAAAQRHGAELRTSFRVGAMAKDGEWLRIESEGGDSLRSRVAVNCAGLYADEVARMGGDDSFEIYPRKGEFMVYDAPHEPLEQILLPVPSEGTKGVLVFPTVDGHVIAGPTAVDGDDKDGWSVRPQARELVASKAAELLPDLLGAEPVASYAGLRPAGRGVNYAIGASKACPGLVNVAAIRSTGLTASLGIAEYVCTLVEEQGIELGPEEELDPSPGTPGSEAEDVPVDDDPWWRRVAEYRGAA
jgi:glycerol-3-phosphate dehydrogenase